MGLIRPHFRTIQRLLNPALKTRVDVAYLRIYGAPMKLLGKAALSFLLLAGAISLPTAHAAWGPDGNNPSGCASPITPRLANVYDSGVLAGQVQLRWSGCYYGVAWARMCAKLWYDPTYALVDRFYAQQNPPGVQEYSNYSGLQTANTCSGYVAHRYTPVVFDNCYNAGMGTCRAYAFGQLFQSGGFVGEAYTGFY